MLISLVQVACLGCVCAFYNLGDTSVETCWLVNFNDIVGGSDRWTTSSFSRRTLVDWLIFTKSWEEVIVGRRIYSRKTLGTWYNTNSKWWSQRDQICQLVEKHRQPWRDLERHSKLERCWYRNVIIVGNFFQLQSADGHGFRPEERTPVENNCFFNLAFPTMTFRILQSN